MRELLIKARNILVFRGILSIIFGISIFVFPLGAAITFAMVIGVAAIIVGVFSSIVAFSNRKESSDWWILLVEGILSLALGIMIISWPVAAIIVTMIWIALWMMSIGLMTIYEAIKLRKQIEGEGWYIFSGLFAFFTGILIVTLPLQAGGMLLYLIASLTILYGLMMLVVVFKLNKMKRHLDKKPTIIAVQE